MPHPAFQFMPNASRVWFISLPGKFCSGSVKCNIFISTMFKMVANATSVKELNTLKRGLYSLECQSQLQVPRSNTV
jgi:hypothetical protein